MNKCTDCKNKINVEVSFCRFIPVCILTEEIDRVTGKETYKKCEHERSFGLFKAVFLGKCGKSGRYFEPKEN